MKRRTRRLLLIVSVIATSTFAVLLLSFLLGRPSLYSDGSREYGLGDLANASMLVWGSPSVRAELPGPVRGRIARLPDGRWIYGRARSPQDTELVVFDPSQPELGVDLVLGASSPAHELAPALSADSWLYFASDRAGGAGGFDIYRMRVLTDGFGEVEHLGAGINTALDEADPAPQPREAKLCFVRRDPAKRGARNGRLFEGRLDRAEPARPVFPHEIEGTRRTAALDRDPIFDELGTTLWFVRELPGQRPRVNYARRHRGAYSEAAPFEQAEPGRFRSPVPISRELFLVEPPSSRPPATTVLVHACKARVVYPYREGQRSLLYFLIAGLVSFGLLVLLLILGDRWRKLDIITQCLLFSILVHLLFLLFLSDVKILRDLLDMPAGKEEGRMRVRILESADRANDPGAEITMRMSDDSSRARFEPQDPKLEVEGPGSMVQAKHVPRVVTREREMQVPDGVRLAQAAPEREIAKESYLARPTRNARDADAVVAPRALTQSRVRPKRRTSQESRFDALGAAPEGQNDVTALRPKTALATRVKRVALGADAEASRKQSYAVTELPKAELEKPQEALRDGDSKRTARRSGLDTGEDRPRSTLAKILDAPRRSPLVSGTSRPTKRAAEGLLSIEAPSTALRARPARRRAGEGIEHRSRGAEHVAAAQGTMPAPRDEDFELRELRRREVAEGGIAVPRPAPLAVIDGPGTDFELPPARRSKITALAERIEDGAGIAGAPATGLRRIDRVSKASVHREERKKAMEGVYRNRVGARKAEALEKFGGTKETETAVERGLAYLAGIQQKSGAWGRRQRRHPKYGDVRVGKTALCALAFLGAGHTPDSKTRYSAQVDKAMSWLLSMQRAESGHFGRSSAYSHGIATYALAECYAMMENKQKRDRLAEPLVRAVAWILVQQSESRDPRNRGGWPYYSDSLRPEDGFSRASVSAWQVMALESAKLSGLEIPKKTFDRAKGFFRHCFDARRGYFLYSFAPSRLRSSWRTLPASTPASMFCLMLLGEDTRSTRMERSMEYVLDRRPQRYRRYSDNDFVVWAKGNVYFWYYATLACFMQGGDAWKLWNQSLTRVLPRAQSPDGSWKPIDVYAEYAGDSNRDRAYTTAMCILSLEVYYRYFTPLLRAR